MAKQWLEFTREKKREERFKRRLSPAGVKFSSPAAKIKYRFKAARLLKTINRESSCCVPVTILNCTASHAGINLKTVMYYPEELKIRG